VELLLRKGCNNVADKFGNTPVMDAVRLGHKGCLLLCLHYQHTDKSLAHIAAEFNRVW
jgi:ankyrin repeat protein